MSPRTLNMAISSLAAGAALLVMMLVWAFITAKLEGGFINAKSIIRISALSFVMGLFFQLSYGNFIYFVLEKFFLYKILIVVLAYLAPVVAVGFFFADTYGDVVGILPWAVYAIGVATAGWFFNSGVWRAL